MPPGRPQKTKNAPVPRDMSKLLKRHATPEDLAAAKAHIGELAGEKLGRAQYRIVGAHIDDLGRLLLDLKAEYGPGEELAAEDEEEGDDDEDESEEEGDEDYEE